jgi:hypothetical protein
MKRYLIIAALTVYGAMANAATMVIPPPVQIQIDGRIIEVPDVKPDVQKDVLVYNWGNLLGNLGISNMTVAQKWDPFVAYGVAVSNFTAVPISFTFIFSTPYVGGPYTLLSSSHSSSVTDSGSKPDGSIMVGTQAGYTHIHLPILDGIGVAGGNRGDGCALLGTPGFSDACDNSSTPNVAVLSAASGILSVELRFVLSPGDIYTANGRVELLDRVVPEPATYAMAGVALLAAALYRRRSA